MSDVQEKIIDKRGTLRKLPPTAFKPGQSGNPAGRPKIGTSITETLRAKFEDQETREAFVLRLIELAKQGNTTAITQIMGRLDGAVPNQLEVKSTGSQAISLDFSKVSDDVLKEAIRNIGKEAK